MSLPGLVLELVLTGGLFLVALFFPYWRVGALELEPTPAVLTLGAALAFLVGVLIDRFADSLLGTWDALQRCAGRRRFGRAARSLIDAAPVDPYPEGWLRHHVLARGEVFEAWARDLRVRIRVARSVTVLAPLVGAAVAVGERAMVEGRGGPPRHALARAVEVCAAGSAAILVLLVVCALAALACQGPRTSAPLRPEEPRRRHWLAGTWKRGDGAPQGWRALVPTPPAVWLVGCGAGFVVAAEGLSERQAFAIGLGTATATLLAWLAWSRISGTYRQFLWDTAWHGAPSELAAALRGKRPGAGSGP